MPFGVMFPLGELGGQNGWLMIIIMRPGFCRFC